MATVLWTHCTLLNANNRQTDRQTDKQVSRQADKWMDRRMVV